MNDERLFGKRLTEGTLPSAPFARSLAFARSWEEAAWSYVLLALVLALPAGGLAWSRRFDGLYGQDAYAYFDYATGSVRESILHLRPLEPFFWPPGYPLLVAVSSLATGAVPLAGQAISLVMGALIPVFTALLVKELMPDDPQLAFGSGLLVALCGQLWQSSIVVMADTTGLALATAGTFMLARYTRTQHPAWLIAASAALAYATLARWIYGLVAIPCAAYALLALRAIQPSRAAGHALAAIALGSLILLPVLGPPLLGLLNRPGEPAAFAGNLQVYWWSPLNAARRDFLTADGHLSYALPNGLYYAMAPTNPAFLGPLIAPWALLGVWRAVRHWRRPTLTLLLGWLLVVYGFHAGAPWQNFRFTLAYLPPLAILGAAGLDWVRRVADRRLRLALAMYAVIGLITLAVAGVRLVHGFIDRKDDDLALVRWAASTAEPGAQVLSFGPTLTFRHYTAIPTFDLFDLTAPELSALLATPIPTYVLVDEASLDQQWLGQAPEVNVTRLRADPGLVPVGQYGTYTLLRATSW